LLFTSGTAKPERRLRLVINISESLK